VVKELRALGENPLCIVRDAGKAREVLGSDARVVVAELSDRPALEKALQGVSRVFVVTGHNPQTAEQQINVLDAAKAAGAQFFVKVSGGRAIVGPEMETVVGRCHHEIEEEMRASGLSWVLLRPGLFMQNMLAQAALIKGESKFVVAVGKDMPMCFIDVRDTGALGARVLRDPAPHAGRTYEFTGARSSYGEFAKDFSDVLGRPVSCVSVTLAQTEQALKARGLPDWLVTHLLVVARLSAEGAFSTPNTQPIKDIVGREPITTRKFVEDFRGTFG
jgi:uncharacterized protein YbjT (DUF2867 family)